MNIVWKDWDLVISASQIETWDDCRRKWWLSKVHKLPELDKGFQIYGNVIHGVADRFFGADDLGYDRATGKPVELYPPGWEISYDRVDKKKVLGTVTPQEQAQIKFLVRKAIEEGIWVRTPGREPEASFFRKVADRIAIIGYIDLMLPDEVHDHKSTKNMRYAKSAADLVTNTQLLIYAAECFERADEQGRKLDKVTVRHNTFSKDPNDPVVRAVSNTVTREQVVKFWAGVVERAKEMRKLKRAGIAAESWSGVQGPKTKDTCEAYGGCAFRTICGKVETPQKYRARIELAQKAQQEGASTLTTGQNDMGIFDSMKSSGGNTATKPASTAAPAPAAQTKPAPAESTAPSKEQMADSVLHPDQVAAPWARSTEKSCRGLGLTRQGKPCRVCDTLNKKDGKPTSDGWTLGTDDAGRITWTPKGEGAAGATPAAQEPRVVDKTTAKDAPAAAPSVAQQPAPAAQAAPAAPSAAQGGGALGKRGRRKAGPAATPAAPSEPAPAAQAQEPAPEAPEATDDQGEDAEPTEANGEARRGRKPQGFTLLIGALPERAKTTGVIGLDQEFERYGTELAKEMGADSYFALDAYKRRDWMAMRARQIAETFGSKIVTAVGTSPDFLEFLTAIKPFASYVYVGVAR